MSLARNHEELIESGRTIAGPPGMRPELLELLRSAFQKVVTNPDSAAAAKKSRRPISFASGQEVADNVKKTMQSPKEYVELIKKAYGTAAQ